jgi:hypothetical protein
VIRPSRFAAFHLALAAMYGLRGPILTPDSADYLEHLIYRPPLTPLVYDVARLGGPLRLYFAVSLQMMIGVAAALVLARSLVRAAGVSSRLVAVATFYILVAPHLQHAMFIMSDSLAYSLLSLAVAYGLDCAVAPTPRALVCCTGWTALAVATRSQLLFLFPILVVGIALYAYTRRTFRPAALAMALLAASTLLQPTYNLVFHGRFLALKAGGVHWLGVVLFVTEPNDLAAVPDGAERAFATAVFERARERHLLRSQLPLYMPEAHHFDRSFDAIAWTTVAQSYCDLVLRRPVGAQASAIVRAMSPDEWRAFDHFTSDIARHLLRQSWWRYLRHIATCAREVTGVALGIAAALFFVGAAGVRRRRGPALVLLFAAGLWLCNLVAISLVQDLRFRYTFPFDVMLIVAALLAAWRFSVGSENGNEHRNDKRERD